jgi:RNA polymerase sigma-70 factor (ECF subfamily)
MLDERQHLLEIAMWMFGSAGTAEWIVQETYRRWYTLDDHERSDILLPKAWLTRAAADISLELLDTGPSPDRAPGPPPVHVPRPATPSDPVTLATHDHLARRFAAACDRADIAALTALMSADAVVVCDGGGKVRAPVRPIRGATEVARFVAALLSGRAGEVLTVEPVNGRAGLTLRRAGRAVAVVSVSIAGDEVTAVWIVLNPDKLHSWHRQ